MPSPWNVSLTPHSQNILSTHETVAEQLHADDDAKCRKTMPEFDDCGIIFDWKQNHSINHSANVESSFLHQL